MCRWIPHSTQPLKRGREGGREGEREEGRERERERVELTAYITLRSVLALTLITVYLSADGNASPLVNTDSEPTVCPVVNTGDQ
jgi:hypothetical protein